MQRNCVLRTAGRVRLKSFTVEYVHATMNFLGLDLTTSDRWHQATTTTPTTVEYKTVARQLSRSDFVVRRRWDQWIRKMSFTCRTGSERSRETSRREAHRILRNARVQPTTPSAAIQAQAARSLRAPVSFQTIQERLA
ncbi:transposable element Tcb2 transposase [Trichonephila clavipes]|nr:transposable element Tcb2 transposase [Trichonephila clavipes]